jgi:hypothetical protein
MSPVLDSPRATVSLEPALRVQCLRCQIGDEADGLVFAADMLTGQQGRLRGEGKADIFGRDRATFECAALGNTSILFKGPCLGGR